jgi:lipopolysaccharide/colanic/teichoic acid biosynthesis glycosyltransferase
LPDPARGRLHDPAPASGHDLSGPGRRFSPVAPGRRTLVVGRPAWEARYLRSVIVSDAVAVTVVCTAAVLFGPRAIDLGSGLLSAAFGPALALLLLVARSLAGALDPAVLGAGSAEYRKLMRGFASTSILLGLAGVATELYDVRFWVFVVIPAASLLAVLGRFVLRLALHRRRAKGECTRHVLAVGTADAIADLISRTRRERHHGWTVTGACTPTGAGLDGTNAILGVPVIGDLDAVAKETRRRRHHIVSVSVTPGWTPARLHRLAWDIQEVGVELVVDPGLTEVAGPRLHVEQVDGLPLLRLTQPALTSVNRLLKALVDRLGAALLLLLLAPLLLGLAVALRSGGGPTILRQTRIGRGGMPFTLLQFRSAITGPDQRVKRLDAWIRRNGLDRLPQLLNVLSGSMSLVGPRPAVPEDLAMYPPEIRAAYVVQPGLSGLWQSSGSTDLSPEEDVRLDLRYVRDWSLTEDAVIAWQSVKAATRPTGDY